MTRRAVLQLIPAQVDDTEGDDNDRQQQSGADDYDNKHTCTQVDQSRKATQQPASLIHHQLTDTHTHPSVHKPSAPTPQLTLLHCSEDSPAPHRHILHCVSSKGMGRAVTEITRFSLQRLIENPLSNQYFNYLLYQTWTLAFRYCLSMLSWYLGTVVRRH